MMKHLREKQVGVTLIEILLVLVIMASLLILASGYMTSKVSESRRDRMVLQMDQILNAGLAYYVNNGKWPGAGVVDVNNDLEKSNYLPNKGTIMSPFSFNYVVSSNTTTGTFSLCTTVPGVKNTTGTGDEYYTSSIEAGILAGRLPMAYVVDGALPSSATTCPPASSTGCNSESCTLVSQVNIPGQNLNNARSLNFAGVYSNGGCVPAPVCPGGTSMTPNIFVVPASVSGNSDGGSSTVYPVSSFTAYAVGEVGSPASTTTTTPTTPNAVSSCVKNTSGNYVPAACSSGTSPALDPKGKYWRVCLFIVTENGVLSTYGNTNWNANSGKVVAITRCQPTNEPSGSSMTVFTSY